MIKLSKSVAETLLHPGPSKPSDTKSFLSRLFNDNDIIEMGGGTFQKLMANFIVKMRTPKVEKQYEQIGGSPIRKWTESQGEALEKELDRISPESAPHKAYTCFRYAHPLTEEALTQMKADGVKRAIAFSQFPHWLSCTTTGSSMNELWRQVKNLGMEQDVKWSLIDRWPLHTKFLDAVIDRMESKLAEFDPNTKDKVVLLFSAHSVPMKVVEKGDVYVNEVSATCKAIMDRWEAKGHSNRHVLAWQSKVGFMPWMVPSTDSAIKALGKKGTKNVLAVPIAFTTDHIETLFEIGIEYAEEAEEAGITNFKYTEGLNGSPKFVDALSDIVVKHLKEQKNHSSQYGQKCLGCSKPMCRKIINPAF
eukprot:jgi/Bigna1/32878/e_gw1.1.414.1